MRTIACFSVLLILSLPAGVHAERVPPLVPDSAPISPTHGGLDEPLLIRSQDDTLWLYVGQEASWQTYCGGEHSGGPSFEETFTFEPGHLTGVPDELGLKDPRNGWPPAQACAGYGPFPLSGRCFTSVDVRTFPSKGDRFYWHLDTYQAWSGNSWWCGTPTGSLCENWDNAPGYGDEWKQYLALEPDLAGVSSGDTVALECRVRYDTECDYDYAYIAYSNDLGSTWATLATFCGTSRGYPVPEGDDCPSNCGGDYYESGDCNRDPGLFPKWNAFPRTDVPPGSNFMIVDEPDSFLVGFQFESDGAWSDEDGRGNTDGAFFVDDVVLKSLGDETLELEDMDGDCEPEKWRLLRPPGIVDYWALDHDPDPPDEPDDPGGPSVCEANATWMWAGAPYLDGIWRIPPEANGFQYRLMTPTISRDWLPDVTKEHVGVIFQFDLYSCNAEQTCDWLGYRVRAYHDSIGEWCEWKRVPSLLEWERACDPTFRIDCNQEPDQSVPGLVGSDSVQFAWNLVDSGQTDDFCWTMYNPHRKTQLLVDNVSIGLYDRSETQFAARAIDLFQDTFDLETDAHNALCANGDMPYPWGTLPTACSLTVDVHDADGLTGANAYVRLYFNADTVYYFTHTQPWSYNDMALKYPDPIHPDLGGTYVGSVAAHEAQINDGAGRWVPGTEVWYYIEVRDDDGNVAYWPATADPVEDPPSVPWRTNYFEFSILPGTGELYQEPHRLLLVDDFGRTDYDFHPAMAETTLIETEYFYESLLYDHGYCWDRYDVNGASTGLSNEPWGILTYPDPANPDSVQRRYDAVIWFTSRFDEYTVKDTMQCILRDFVFDGGDLFLCGNHIGEDMTDHGLYVDSADTCDFYSGLCGAEIGLPPGSPPGIRNPHLFATGNGIGGLWAADSFHFHLGCPVNDTHDLMRINDNLPPWSSPQPYLIYAEGYSPGDTLVATYNDITHGGKVVHMCFDMAAMVDSSATRGMMGRSELMASVLTNLFGVSALCAHI